MISIYQCTIDDGTNTVRLTIDPIISPLPVCERQVRQYTSVLSFSVTGTLKNSRTHTVDAGVAVGSGVSTITFQHLGLTQYNLLKGMFASVDPPIKVDIYDYRQNTTYLACTLRNLKDNYIEGVKCADTYEGDEQRQISGSFEFLCNYPSGS